MNKSKIEELNLFLSSPFFLDMDFQKAIQIAKRFSKNKDHFKKGFRKIKLAIVSNFNIDFLVESLDFCLYQRGLSVEIFVPRYGTMFTELINSNSSIYKFKPDYILIWPTFRDIQKYHVSSNNEIAFWSKLWNVPIQISCNRVPSALSTRERNSFAALLIGHLILKNSLIIFEIFLPLLGFLGSLIFLSNRSKISLIVLLATIDD